MIIDCHCHAGKGDGLTGPWDTTAPLQTHLKRAVAAGINQTVIFPAFHSDYSRANEAVCQLVECSPDQLMGFAFIHPVRDAGRVWAMVKKAIQEYGFLGLKVHRHDGRITREICDAARAFSLPVLYDVVGEVSTVELLASEYPDVNFIIPHLGSFADSWSAQLNFIPMLERHPNVYTDTSGVRRFDLLEMAVRRAGAEKVLFGSDGPWLHPAVELSKVFALKIPRKLRNRILGENLLRLIGQVRSRPKVIPAQAGQSSWMVNRPAPDLLAAAEITDPWLGID